MGSKAELGRQRAPWAELVLVCSKCARRQDRGGLKSQLKAGWRERCRPGKLRVVETSCMGLCPKRGIAAATASGLARGEVVVIASDEPADTILDGGAPRR